MILIRKYNFETAVTFFLSAIPFTLSCYFIVGNLLYPDSSNYYQLNDFTIIVIFQLFLNGLFAYSKKLNTILIIIDLIILFILATFIIETETSFSASRVITATISYSLVLIFANYFANFIATLTNDLIVKEKDLIESNEVKKKMLSIVAHDLRSPFISLNGAIQLLKQTNLSESEKKDFMEIIFKSSNDISSLLENLLHWSATQLKGLKSDPKPINLTDICVDCISLFNLETKNKAIKLSNNLPNECIVLADFNMITLVIRNLLSNALKFTAENGLITFETVETEHSVIFTITDSGIGLSDVQIEQFSSKQIESSSGTANEKGSGLGLILCNDFLELHHSKLNIQSDANGSRFSFSLMKP